MSKTYDKILHMKNCNFNKLVIIFLFFLFLLLTIFLHPTQEIIDCGSTYKCSIKHQFLNFLDIENKMEINSNSKLEFKESTIFLGHLYTHYHIILDDKRIFIYPFTEYSWSLAELGEELSQEKINNAKFLFMNYIKNPKIGLVLDSEIDASILYFMIYGVFAIFLLLYTKIK